MHLHQDIRNPPVATVYHRWRDSFQLLTVPGDQSSILQSLEPLIESLVYRRQAADRTPMISDDDRLS